MAVGVGSVMYAQVNSCNQLFFNNGTDDCTQKFDMKGVKPIVYLNSRITLDDLEISSNGEEESWKQ
ncbi:MAG: hypothetical protein HFJ45_08010 [Clostridia bacterium]|nr:hypothetical protein [Clostridia bacterium]